MHLSLPRTAALYFFGLWLATPPAVVQADDDAPLDMALRNQRLELLESRALQFELSVAGHDDRRLAPGKEPILRWSNPIRDNVNDGVIFLFLEGVRPRAIVTVWADGIEGDLTRGRLYREFVSLSSEPLECRRNGDVLWSPKTGGLVNQELKDAPAPATRPVQRLAQMRALARRFQAVNYKMDSPSELRLLTQPLHRYAMETAEVLDGALFAYVEGNDPEVLLLLEAVSADGGKSYAWRYYLARMTSYRVSAKLDGREVFAAAPYWKNPRAATDPYSEAADGTFQLDRPAAE